MARTKISEFSATPANNTDIDSINIAEGCAPSGINDAIRELMAQLKDFQTGAVGDSFNGPVGSTTAGTGAFTTLSASGTATLSGLTASTALALDASKNIVSVTNTGTGSNVLATSPTLVTPALGTPSSGVVTNLTGTASININGTVGATTATTGAFTTLAASSTVTLSGGTANGVAYLNGSKVVTSGSALTFDGTSLGVGTASPAEKVGINQGNIYALRTGGAKLRLADQNNECSVESSPTSGDSQLVFKSNATEGMRLTSTGLGIGTSSPDQKLDVNGAAVVRGQLTARQTSALAFDYATSGGARARIISYGANTSTAGVIAFSTESSDGSVGGEVMRLDSSGVLGLGVTPAAWGSSIGKTLQINTGGSFSADLANAYFAANSYYNGTNWIYQTSTHATRYTLGSNFHAWYTAPTGTAGNAITFTQAMTLNASGNLLVSTTSDSGNSLIREVAIKGPSNGVARTFVTTDSGIQAHFGATQFNSGNTGFVGTITSNPFQFLTNDTERMRLDTSGNLLVGTTSTYASAKMSLGFVGSASNGLIINNTNSSGSPVHMAFQLSGTSVGNITCSGSSTAYNTSSDYRLKNTIAPMTGALAKVALLKPCTYKWNADGSDGQGFIAHELAEVVPQCVTGEKDAVDEEGNPKYQGIDTSFLVATLTAALQEAVAKINSLEARLDAANL